MVEVKIGGMSATIVGYEWTEGDELLLSILRQDVQIRDDSLSYDPFPAFTIAQEAIDRYGGEIVRQKPPVFTEGAIY